MPLSDLHKKQKEKNYTLLIVLLALVGMFFMVSLVKLAG